MRDLGGAPAWEGECVPMMHAQPCTSLLAPTVLQTPLRAVCGSVWSGLNPSPSVHVTQTGTPLALTPVCTGSSHQLEEELKFKTLKGREILSSTRGIFSVCSQHCKHPQVQQVLRESWPLCGSHGDQGLGSAWGCSATEFVFQCPLHQLFCWGDPPELGPLFSHWHKPRGVPGQEEFPWGHAGLPVWGAVCTPLAVPLAARWLLRSAPAPGACSRIMKWEREFAASRPLLEYRLSRMWD